MNQYEITQFLSIETKLYFFENWSKGGILYVKDLLYIDGNFRTLEEFSDGVLTKNNWLCEYYILKNVFSKASVTIVTGFCPEFHPPFLWRSKHQTRNDC